MTPPTHPLLSRRASGVLLHLTSLPGPHGSGDLGAEAGNFLGWLQAAGQTLWQVLPLTPSGAGASPYQSASAFAGSPWLVDLDDLVRCGWLDAAALQRAPPFPAEHCDFARVLPWRAAALRAAWQGFAAHAGEPERQALADFVQAQAHWLDDYALFMLLHERHGEPWNRWPAPYAWRDAQALAALRREAAAELDFWHFVQWRFHVQWQGLRALAQARGVHFVGDMPIFVAHHSADVWARPQLFQLDANGAPLLVAGVPPDYFSATGQRWGNPLYRWDAMATDGYAWWAQRLAHLLSLVDVVRIDHFRGFEACWAIPAHAPTAEGGHWQAGPGRALFDALRERLGPLPVIAEDLGLITEAVHRLREDCGFPGMRVAQFAFGDTAANPYLPHNYEPRTVAYTGTHDNDTTVGWWQSMDAAQRRKVLDYLGPAAAQEIHWALLQSLSQSVARTLVVPLQDVLGLDGSHRMNTPGHTEGCWRWRFEWSQIGPEAGARLAAMARAHGRSAG